jgi:hypothetical protein
LRDLNTVNTAAKSTKFVFTISLIIPLVMGLCALALADGAAPEVPLRDNYLEILSLGIIAITIMCFPVPYIFKWDWQAKYFGALTFPLASGSIMGIYPLLCIIQYSSLPVLARLSIAILVSFAIVRWTSRVTRVYKAVYENKRLFFCIYEEEPTAVYYLQQADRKICEKLFHLDLFPNPKYALLCFVGAFLLAPFASSVSQFFGLPFTHVFLAVFAAPLDLVFIGIATKVWLACYFYPNKIKKITNKRVYVDMSSQPVKSINSIS